jgi:hypothetical protein
MGNMFRLILKSSSQNNSRRTWHRQFSLQDKETASAPKEQRTAVHEDGHHPIKTYHSNPILKHNTEITKPAFIIFIIFLKSYFI